MELFLPFNVFWWGRRFGFDLKGLDVAELHTLDVRLRLLKLFAWAVTSLDTASPPAGHALLPSQGVQPTSPALGTLQLIVPFSLDHPASVEIIMISSPQLRSLTSWRRPCRTCRCRPRSSCDDRPRPHTPRRPRPQHTGIILLSVNNLYSLVFQIQPIIYVKLMLIDREIDG